VLQLLDISPELFEKEDKEEKKDQKKEKKEKKEKKKKGSMKEKRKELSFD